MKKFLIVFGVVVSVAGVTLAQGGPGCPPPEHRDGPGEGAMRCGMACPMYGCMRGGPGGMLLIRRPALAEKVGLTKEDVQKLRDLVFEHQKEMIKLQAAAEQAQLDLEMAKSAATPKTADVEKAIDAAHRARAEIEKARYRHLLAVREIISEERWEQLWKNMREMRQERRVEHREGRRFGMNERLGRMGKHAKVWDHSEKPRGRPQRDAEDVDD